MTEVKIIKQSLSKDGGKAFERGKNKAGAYIMRGNSIVRVTSDGSIEVVKRTARVKVRLKDSDRVVVIK